LTRREIALCAAIKIATACGRDEVFTPPADPGDQGRHPGGPDPQGDVPIKKVRNIYIPDIHIGALNVMARNFR
jgi:hypothetical protein